MRFTVGRKIGLGFIIVGLLMLIVFGVTMSTTNSSQTTLKSSIEANNEYTEVVIPTENALDLIGEDIEIINRSVNDWVYNTTTDLTHLNNLKYTLDSALVNDTIEMNEISLMWKKNAKEDKKIYSEIKKQIIELDGLIRLGIIEGLPDFASKNDPTSKFMAENALEEINPLIEDIKSKLNGLTESKKKESAEQKISMNNKFTETSDKLSFLYTLIIGAMIVLVIGTMVIAVLTSRSITKPVHQLKGILVNLGKGIFPREKVDPSNDEIGEMSIAMNQLVDGLKGTTNFANEVGKSNFGTEYTPLSDEDVLGHALVKMRDELAESERILEQKVVERTAEVVRQKEEIETQSEKLEELYQDITASIRYAKRLQDSILPQDSYIQRILPESFVLFKPKDIVSGDFYWFSESEDKVFFSAVDCTGHGVPGAFMSLIGANALNRAVTEVNAPDLLLNQLNKLSSEALNKSEGGREKVRDGMDVALCALSKDGKKLEYSGANNPLYIIRDGEITVTKADKLAIASFEDGQAHYTNHEIDVQKGDLIYIFSDGYADQFGGLKGKKFMYRQFRDTLKEIMDLPMDQQKTILNEKIEKWRGDFEQVDDILVIGVRI